MSENRSANPLIAAQDAKLEKWSAGEGIPFASEEAAAAYRFRAGIFRDAVTLKKSPARVPVFFMGGFAVTKLYGMTGKQAMYEPVEAAKKFLDFSLAYSPDAAPTPRALSYGPPLEMLDYALYKWPGHGVADTLSFQYVEKEYMPPTEYDSLINDPTDFWLRHWLPRTHGALAPLANLPPLYGTMELAMCSPWLSALGAPPVQEALRALLDAAKSSFEWNAAIRPVLLEIMAAGYPGFSGGYSKAPFDVISDTLRGTTPLMTDLYRRPAKVLEAVERLVPLMIDLGVSNTLISGNPIVFMPLHKGADGFMSNDQFAKFYWPSLKAVIKGLAAKGCVPCLFIEGAYNQRLEFLAEIDDCRMICLFDRTDMVKAREALGGKVCIAGGFPASLILTGTPEEVRSETIKLLNEVKGDGGYMLTIGCSMDEVRGDTLKAFIETGKEFGLY